MQTDKSSLAKTLNEQPSVTFFVTEGFVGHGCNTENDSS
jgi:hypothetical protein